VTTDASLREESAPFIVAKEIGPVAKPDDIRFAEALPKTRSGKIMRRLLKNKSPPERRSKATHHAGRLQRAGPPGEQRENSPDARNREIPKPISSSRAHGRTAKGRTAVPATEIAAPDSRDRRQWPPVRTCPTTKMAGPLAKTIES